MKANSLGADLREQALTSVRISIRSPLSLKPLQDLSNDLTGAIDSRTVSPLTQERDVAQRRLVKKAAVLAAELGGALIADLERSGRCIQMLRKHQPPRFVQTQPFLELQRTHGRQPPKVVMEG